MYISLDVYLLWLAVSRLRSSQGSIYTPGLLICEYLQYSLELISISKENVGFILLPWFGLYVKQINFIRYILCLNWFVRFYARKHFIPQFKVSFILNMDLQVFNVSLSPSNSGDNKVTFIKKTLWESSYMRECTVRVPVLTIHPRELDGFK